MDLSKFLDWIKSQSPGIKITVLLAAALGAAALFFSSCSHSRMSFRGQGELEYEYEGERFPRSAYRS